MRKAFEKKQQTKAIEDQGKKQIDALKDLKHNKEKQIKAIEDKSDDKLSIQETFFKELLDNKMDEIHGFRGRLNIYEEIKNGNIGIKKQKKIKRNLNQI